VKLEEDKELYFSSTYKSVQIYITNSTDSVQKWIDSICQRVTHTFSNS
jgi:hypothetical protein